MKRKRENTTIGTPNSSKLFSDIPIHGRELAREKN
tara:strand:+ start:86 stop:190 length:105 start_codon:yes stop_codon:yes gene_type:complete